MLCTTIVAAIAEAEKFIAVAKPIAEMYRAYGESLCSDLNPPPFPSYKDTATLRRRSMDLTRALAEMRRPS